MRNKLYVSIIFPQLKNLDEKYFNTPLISIYFNNGGKFLHSKMLTHKRKFVLMLIIWTYKCWCKGWQYSTLSKPQTWTLSPTHNLTTTTCGWLANITHGILFRILLSHCDVSSQSSFTCCVRPWRPGRLSGNVGPR